MNVYYIVKATNIYLHGIFAILDIPSTSEKAAIDLTQRFANNDVDDFHDWSLHLVDTSGSAMYNIGDAKEDYFTVGKQIGYTKKSHEWTNTK